MNALDTGINMGLDRMGFRLGDPMGTTPTEVFSPQPEELPNTNGTLSVPPGAIISPSGKLLQGGRIIGDAPPEAVKPIPKQEFQPSTLDTIGYYASPGAEMMPILTAPYTMFGNKAPSMENLTPKGEKVVQEMVEKTYESGFGENPNPITMAKAMWGMMSPLRPGGQLYKAYKEDIPVWAQMLGEIGIDAGIGGGIGWAAKAGLISLKGMPKVAQFVLNVNPPKETLSIANKISIFKQLIDNTIDDAAKVAAQNSDNAALIAKNADEVKRFSSQIDDLTVKRMEAEKILRANKRRLKVDPEDMKAAKSMNQAKSDITNYRKQIKLAGQKMAELQAQIADAKRSPAVKKLVGLFERMDDVVAETKELRKKPLAIKGGEAADEFSRVFEETGDAEKALSASRSRQYGALPKAEWKKVADWTDDDTKEIIREIERWWKEQPIGTADYKKLNAVKATLRVFKDGEAPRAHEVAYFREIFGDDFASSLVKVTQNHGKWKKFLDVANIPRALMASFDMSALGRQLLFSAPRQFLAHPVRSIETTLNGFKILLGKSGSKTYDYLDDAMRNSEEFEKLKHLFGNNLEFTDKVGVNSALSHLEEPFQSNLADKIPWVRRSNQAFAYVVNKMRYDDALDALNRLERMNQATPENLEMMGKLIMTSTGRGDINWLNKMIGGNVGPAANALLFSPRALMARWQWPFYSVKAMIKNPALRVEVAKRWASTMGLGISTMAILNQSGVAKVEFDPRSADFGKLIVGKKTRVDIWGGYVQNVRFLAQLASRKRKSTTTGKLIDQPMWDTITRYVQSKESPSASTVQMLLGGDPYYTGMKKEDYTSFASWFFGGDGDPEWTPEGISREMWELTAPLFIQSLLGALVEEGAMGAIYAAPEFFGSGVQTYTTSKPRASRPIKLGQGGLNLNSNRGIKLR